MSDHKLGLNVFLQPLQSQLSFYGIQVIIEGTRVTAKSRYVEQAKFPYKVGILVLVDTCIFLDVVRGGLSDGFASDEVDELVK